MGGDTKNVLHFAHVTEVPSKGMLELRSSIPTEAFLRNWILIRHPGGAELVPSHSCMRQASTWQATDADWG